MSKRKDQRKVRLAECSVQDAENTLKVINELRNEFQSTEKKLRLTYNQASAASFDQYARGQHSSWTGPASSYDRWEACSGTDMSTGDARSVPPSPFSILHADTADQTRAHWIDQELPLRDPHRSESADSAATFVVPRRPHDAAVATPAPSTPTFKFVDAAMPQVPPTPEMARHLLARIPREPPASWTAVASPWGDGHSGATAWPSSMDRVVPPADVVRENGVAPDVAVDRRDGPASHRPPTVRKSMKLTDWDLVDEADAAIPWSGPVPKRKSMKYIDTAPASVPSSAHLDVDEGRGEKIVIAEGQRSRERVVPKKSVIDPATVLASYPGFCDVRDLDKNHRPKAHLDVIQGTKSLGNIREANLGNKDVRVDREFAPRKKSTITPSTWREERNKLNTKTRTEKVPVNVDIPNEKEAQSDIGPAQTNVEPNSPATPKEEEIPKPIKRFKPRPPKPEVREPREKSPPKVRHYDVEQTREFIERQKQERLAKLAIEKEKKQSLREAIAAKLKALQEKQLQIVRANVESRVPKRSASGRPVQRQPSAEASAPPQRPERPLPTSQSSTNREDDRPVQTRASEPNDEHVNGEQNVWSATPRQAIVISNSPPEKLEKPSSRRAQTAAADSRLDAAQAEAQMQARNSKLVEEIHTELRKMNSNTENLKSVDLTKQLESVSNDLSQPLVAKSEASERSHRRDGSTVHQHLNITTGKSKIRLSAPGGLSSVLGYDRKRKRNQAATKIQAAFRGYRVRKMKESHIKFHKKYEFFKNPDDSCASDVSEGPLSDGGSNKEVNEEPAYKFQFDLRQYQLQPQPNNFISAVKQKLKVQRNNSHLNCWESPPKQEPPNAQVKIIPNGVDKSNSKIPGGNHPNESPRSVKVPPRSSKSYSEDFDDTFASSIISMVNGSSSSHSKQSIVPTFVNDLKSTRSESTSNLIIPNVALVRKKGSDNSVVQPTPENISVSTSRPERGPQSKRLSHSRTTTSRESSARSRTEKTSLGVFSSENLSSVQEKLSSSENDRVDDESSIHAGKSDSERIAFPADSRKSADNRQKFDNLNNNRIMYPPNALHLQFQAELNLLDSVEESRRQLLEVEKMRAVNLAQQGSSSLAHALKCAQAKHEAHLSAVERKSAFEEALRRERLELQKFFKDALKNQTLSRKSSSESSKVAAPTLVNSVSNVSKSSISEVLESNQGSGGDAESSIRGSSINASVSENVEDDNSNTESVSDLDLSSLDITRKMNKQMPQLAISVNAASDLAAVKESSENGGASMAKFSFHLLEQLVRDEELRAQHQMSLLKLQDKTLTEKTKAEMAWLEVKKRQLRGKGLENQMSAIKKKQRGLILKLQQDKEELARVKETQRIASEERKIMLRSQQHALRMDLAVQNAFFKTKPMTNGNDFATPLKHSKASSEIISEHRSNSNGEQSKDTTLVETDLQQSDVPESISVQESQSDKSISTQSAEQSTEAKVDVQYIEQLVLDGLKKLEKNKRFLNEQAKELQLRREAVEKSLAQRKRFANEEKKVLDLEAQESALALSNNVAQKQVRSFRDSSTSPFQTIDKQDSKSTISEQIAISESSVIPSDPSVVKSSSANPVTMVDKSTSASVATENYVDESFESAVSSEANSNATALNQETHSKSSTTRRSQPEQKPNPALIFKASLSPLVTNKTKRRYSSGSDDSVIYSQTETTSEQSDAEGRITALNEQLKRRMLEAERLRREQKRLNRERLSCKEQTLLKQIQEYDKIIARAKQDIELEHDNHQSVSIVRPKIKQPRVAEKKQSHDAAGYSFGSQSMPSDLRRVRIIDIGETENKSSTSPVKSVINDGARTPIVADSIATPVAEQKGDPEASEKSSNDALSISEHIDDASEGNMSGSESRKSLSDDSSAETTIHSLVPSLKSDGQDKKEVVPSRDSTQEQPPRTEEDNDGKVEAAVENPQEQADVEAEEALSVVSSVDENDNSADTSQGLLEDLDDNSVDHTPEVIKIFFDEKVPAAETSARDFEESAVLSETRINDTGISEGPLEEEFSPHEQEIEQDTFDGPAAMNETFVIERESVDVSAQLKALAVDRVTDSILRQLLVECVTPPRKRNRVSIASPPPTSALALGPDETRDQMVEDNSETEGQRSDRGSDHKIGVVADDILAECLRECTQRMVKLNKGRMRRNASPRNVRRRVHEIMAETSALQTAATQRARKRPQDLMISTYDVLSPDEEVQHSYSSDNSFDNDYLDAQSKSPGDHERTEVDLGVALSPAGESGGADKDGFTQEWFDEDFGLGTTHTKREAEELRIQQLQIEQEIQQLQQAQEQIPYFYIREIPNKPPPPYTPPGQSPPRPGSRGSPESKRRQARNVAATQEETALLAATATDYLYVALLDGADLNLLQPPDAYYEAGDSDSQNTFKTLIFDLVKEIVKDAYDWEMETWHPSWERPLCSNKPRKLKPRSKEMLQDIVRRKTLSYLGFVQKSGKENMIMSWGRKKRDFVDELLMQEAHEEEESWINYDEDETNLKNDITLAIFQSLLEESVQVFRNIRERRHKKESDLLN